MQRLLEREDELGTLTAVVERAAGGTGSLVFVGGEAGIGKTSLVRALRERVCDRASFLVGACEPLSVPIPLGRGGPGTVIYAPGGVPHTFRVESDTARMICLSTPAGIEEMILGLAEPARWPWLQPPPDGPRVSPDRQATVEVATGMVRHGPPPPPGTPAP